MATVLKESVEDYIANQIVAIDKLLINAYGTVLKSRVRHKLYKSELSKDEEMLLAKNLYSNLWSVLDYCCTIIYCWHHNEIPNPQEGRECKFATTFKFNKNLEEWEKEELNRILLREELKEKRKEYKEGEYKKREQEWIYDELIGKYDKLKGILYEIQRTAHNKPRKYFYLLHFLRNQLIHRSIQFQLDFSREKVEIKVPEEPWENASCDDLDGYKAKSLTDIHLRCWKVAKEYRDKLIDKLDLRRPHPQDRDQRRQDLQPYHLRPRRQDLQPYHLRQQPQLEAFEELYQLKIRGKKFIKAFAKGKYKTADLHLSCYGLEGKFKEILDGIHYIDKYCS